MSIKLLDCTLREAPIENSMFGVDNIIKIINGLDSVGVEIIECGFLDNCLSDVNSSIFNNTNDVIRLLNGKNKNLLYLLLINYGHYDINNLANYDENSVDGIRICFKKQEKKEALHFAYKVKDKGYKVFIQNYDTLGYSKHELTDLISEINELKPFAFSIVDTFGAMFSKDLSRILSIVDENLDTEIKLGFHGHNNIMLANANSEEFISAISDKRDIFVDSTLFGCGRGAGNANTEILASFLNKFYSADYNMLRLLNLADELLQVLQQKCSWGYSIPYFLAGLHEMHVKNTDLLTNRFNMSNTEIMRLIEMIPAENRKINSNKFLNEIEHCLMLK